MHPRMPVHKVDVLFKCHYFCCIAQKHSNGLSGLYLTRTFTKKSFCRLSFVKQGKVTLQGSLVSLPSISNVYD